MRSRLYNFTNRMSLACGMIPFERIESLRPISLRFCMSLGGDGADDLEVMRYKAGGVAGL